LSVSANGGYTYTPAAGYSGPDAFTYFVADSFSRSASATVSITVSPLQLPSAADYTATVDYDTPLAVAAPQGLLSKDTGTTLTVTSFTPVATPVTVAGGGSATGATAHGSVTVKSDGSYTYTPDPGYHGPDSFNYAASDKFADLATGTVTLNVLPPPPTAPNYSEATPFKTPLVVTTSSGVLSGADGTGLSAKVTAPPLHGNLTLSTNGNYTYTPYATFTGTDSFTYLVTDTFGQTSAGTVTITVGPKLQAAPTAADYSEQTTANTALVVSATQGVLSLDTGDTIAVTSSTQPSHGSVTVNPDGSYTYTPSTDFVGTDHFGYTITDAEHRTATGTVTVTVVAGQAPTANSYSESTPFNTALSVDAANGLTSNDTGTGLTFSLNTPAAHGTAVVNANGSYTYTPATDFVGTDTFGYTATDASQATATATVTVVVQPPAPPTAADYGQTVAEGSGLTVDVGHGLASADTGTGLTFTLTGGPTNGTATVHADGSYTYIPQAGFSGHDSFTYRATDVGAQSASGTVTITVLAPTPLPVVTQVLPGSGPQAGGTTVQIIGTGFTGATVVTFGTTNYPVALTVAPNITAVNPHNTTSPTFALVSSTLITLVDPAGTGTEAITVTTPAGTSAVTPASQFTYTATVPPTTPTTTTTTTTIATAGGGTTPPAAGATPTTAPAAVAANAAAPAAPAAAAPATPAATPQTHSLAYTGIEVTWLLDGGVLAILVGGLLLLVDRRQRRRPGRN